MMRQTVSNALYAYWNEVRKDRLAPRRFEIDPARIAALLPDTFIIERIDGETSRFRLAGTRICDVFGVEFRGVNVFDLFSDEDRTTLQRQISVIALHGAVGRFVIAANTATTLTAKFEMSLMPLVHTREIVDRFLGSIAALENLPWLGTVPLTTLRILSHDLVWPDGRPHAMIDNMHRQPPFVAHLGEGRIVRSDRRQFRVYDGGLSVSDED